MDVRWMFDCKVIFDKPVRCLSVPGGGTGIKLNNHTLEQFGLDELCRLKEAFRTVWLSNIVGFFFWFYKRLFCLPGDCSDQRWKKPPIEEFYVFEWQLFYGSESKQDQAVIIKNGWSRIHWRFARKNSSKRNFKGMFFWIRFFGPHVLLQRFQMLQSRPATRSEKSFFSMHQKHVLKLFGICIIPRHMWTRQQILWFHQVEKLINRDRHKTPLARGFFEIFNLWVFWNFLCLKTIENHRKQKQKNKTLKLPSVTRIHFLAMPIGIKKPGICFFKHVHPLHALSLDIFKIN